MKYKVFWSVVIFSFVLICSCGSKQETASLSIKTESIPQKNEVESVFSAEVSGEKVISEEVSRSKDNSLPKTLPFTTVMGEQEVEFEAYAHFTACGRNFLAVWDKKGSFLCEVDGFTRIYEMAGNEYKELAGYGLNCIYAESFAESDDGSVFAFVGGRQGAESCFVYGYDGTKVTVLCNNLISIDRPGNEWYYIADEEVSKEEYEDFYNQFDFKTIEWVEVEE